MIRGGWERPPLWAVIVTVAGLVAIGVMLPFALNRSAPVAGAVPTAAPTSTAAAVRMAVIGDSVSEADSPDFAKGDLGPGSWVQYAVGDGLVFAGGYAEHGATTGELLKHAAHVDADVVVIVAGTNDSGQGVPFATSADNLRQIAAALGAHRVIVSAIPPRDADPAAASAYNRQLQALAAAQGWEFVDAMAGVRSGDRYAPGMTADGIHPTVQAAQIIGAAIRKQILGS